jgi:hypothetical protein
MPIVQKSPEKEDYDLNANINKIKGHAWSKMKE